MKKIEPSNIVLHTDILNNIFLVHACTDNHTDTRLSDSEFLFEYFYNTGTWEDVFGNFKNTTDKSSKYEARFKTSESWDYEHIECDVEIIVYDVRKIK